MTRLPATEAEVCVAAIECAESAVAMSKAQVAHDKARQAWKAHWSQDHATALTAAERALAAAQRRFHAAVQDYLAIRPTKEN